MEAQCYPEDFTGIIAGAPANNWTRLLTAGVWNWKALTESPGSAIPAAKLAAIQRAAVEACDKADGLERYVRSGGGKIVQFHGEPVPTISREMPTTGGEPPSYHVPAAETLADKMQRASMRGLKQKRRSREPGNAESYPPALKSFNPFSTVAIASKSRSSSNRSRSCSRAMRAMRQSLLLRGVFPARRHDAYNRAASTWVSTGSSGK